MYPKLTINREKFEANLSIIKKALEKSGISFSFVTKVFCAMPELCRLALPYIDHFADSRSLNLQKIPEGKPRILLRLPMAGEAAHVAALAEMSLNSELTVIKALNAAAKEMNRVHGIILMTDMGDLREGYFKDEDLLREASEIAKLSNVRVRGLGVNLSCYGGVIPEIAHMDGLVSKAKELEALLGHKLDIISGGNTSSLKFVFDGTMPKGITNLRIGEAVVRGADAVTGEPFPGMYQDVFTFECEVIELKEKPSVPIGDTGFNAFGERLEFADRGTRRRAIVAAGRQDVDPDGLAPMNPGHEVLGASSDHLIIDVQEDKGLRVGQIIKFDCSYSAILRACTSPYVVKELA